MKGRNSTRKHRASAPPREANCVNTNGKSDRLLRVSEVAERLGVSVRTVWALRSSGEIPDAVKIANATRWRRSDIETYIRGLRAENR